MNDHHKAMLAAFGYGALMIALPPLLIPATIIFLCWLALFGDGWLEIGVVR